MIRSPSVTSLCSDAISTSHMIVHTIYRITCKAFNWSNLRKFDGAEPELKMFHILGKGQYIPPKFHGL